MDVLFAVFCWPRERMSRKIPYRLFCNQHYIFIAVVVVKFFEGEIGMGKCNIIWLPSWNCA